jgi:hypothetical protein
MKSSFDAWLVIHNKQEEYWQKYLAESDSCIALYGCRLNHAASCAARRADEWLSKYTTAGEIKQLFL